MLVNSQRLQTDTAPLTMEGRTMVPMRAIFESLDADVHWDSQTEQITGKQGANEVILEIDSRLALLNGEHQYLDVPPTLINGRTMVPTRFIAESLGAEVTWDGSTRTVTIILDAEPAQLKPPAETPEPKQATPPPAPTGVRAETLSASEIIIYWNYVSGADYYKLYEADNYQGPYYELYADDSGENRFAWYSDGIRIHSIQSGATMYYKVSAVKNGLDSQYSAIVSATTFSPEPVPEPEPEPEPEPAEPALPAVELHLFAEDGTYLGKLTTNQYDPDGIFNEFGIYGSRFSADSIWNEYGRYGSSYSPQSAFNDYALNPPYIISTDDIVVGRLTTNEFVSDAICPTLIYDVLLYLGL